MSLRGLPSVILSAARRAQSKNLAVVLLALFCALPAFAAPKSASAYYSDAAFQYIENRLPTAEITCNEGLQYYPNDQKLQMLLDRIKEAKDEQKNENQKKDPKNDQNNDQNQDQNQDQNKDNQDQNQDQQNQDQNSGESSSSQGEDQQNQDQNGGQSSSSSEQSSDSNGGADQQEQPQDQGSSDSQGEQPEMPPEVPEGQMNPADAAQLLKDFDEQNGERKPWKPVRGQARPAKDW